MKTRRFDIHKIANPFTPKSGMSPRYLVGRDKEITEFSKILERSINEGYNDHFIVLGEWGTGKTSLFKEFQSLAQMKGVPTAHITTRVFTKDDKEVHGIVDVIEQLSEKLPIPSHKLKHFIESLNGVNVLGSGLNFDKEHMIKNESPLILLLKTLKHLYQDLKTYKTVLILVDDAQNFEAISTIFMTFRQVLSDEQIVKTNFLFGLACTPHAYRQFMTERNHPIGRYFTRIHLGNLTEKDTQELIAKNLKDTGVTFPQTTTKTVYETTNGQPYEVQVYCSQLFDKQLKGKVTLEQQKLAEKATIQYLGESIFEGWLAKASEKEKETMKLIAKHNQPTKLQKIIGNHRIVASNFERLYEKLLIEKPQRGVYHIPDYFFRQYLLSK